MAITAVVTPGETYPDSTNVTRAMLRNGAAPAIAIAGDIENADIADAAAIDFDKLEPLANGSVIVGNANSVATECTVTNGSMAVSGSNVTITPSDATITHAKLASGSSNVVKGATLITSAASGDLLLVADASDSDNLKSITLGNISNSGTFEQITPAASVNMDVGKPIHTLAINVNTALTPTGHPASSSEFKSSVLYITNGTGGNLDLTLVAGAGSKAWSVLEYSSATPSFTIAASGSAVLSVMAFSGNQVGAFAATS
jgi:hypothetical protein